MSMNRGSSMQNGLTDTVTLTFDLLTPKAYHLEYIPRSSLYGIIRFFIYAADKQANKQNRQTNKRSRASYTYTPTDMSVWVMSEKVKQSRMTGSDPIYSDCTLRASLIMRDECLHHV